MVPEISIIVPVYNIELYVGRCLKSIITQSFSNFEVIVIDDGSTDSTGKICDEYMGIDSRIKVVHKEHKGVSAARNEGLKMSQGKYLSFVDGDDWLDKDMYKKLYALILETHSDIAISNLGREVNGKIINKQQKYFIKEMDNVEAMRQIFKGELYRFSLCNKLFKKSCFKNIEFPQGRIHEDLTTTYKVFGNCDKAVYVNYIGYIYVKRENSILTSPYNENRLDLFISWDEIFAYIEENYPQIDELVIESYAYGCIDHIYYILDQVNDKKEKMFYLTFIKSHIGRHYKTIMKNRHLPLRNKRTIILLQYNINLLLVLNNFKSCFKKIYFVSNVG